MADVEARRSYLRDREDEDSARVSFVELFFDLVFVFAVTQLATYLNSNLTPEGLVRTAVLFVAVWWLWVNSAWATNRLDPDRSVVRIVIFALMAAGLMVSVSIPDAFDTRGMVFAAFYVAMQVLRSMFLVWALWREKGAQRATFARVGVWFALSGAAWIGGALVPGDARIILWTLAVVVELMAPWIGFWVPGLGHSPVSDWDIEGEHLAERCGLFIIIALGESLLVTGARMATLQWDAGTLAAFAVALAGSLVMWWVYFDTGAKRGTIAFERSKDPGRLARFAYTYVHLPIVAGVVVSAVGDKQLLADPLGPVTWPIALTLLGGPALFLTGNLLFKDAISRRWPLSHLIGIGALAVVLPVAGLMTPLAIGALAVLALALVAVLERVFLRSRAAVAQGVN